MIGVDRQRLNEREYETGRYVIHITYGNVQIILGQYKYTIFSVSVLFQHMEHC